ncbi:type IV secretory system conjugative DNA transfer family protein [Neobacillus pocheonensis]|uniref:VirD4-like conjugal transfer protein, CD1115 family n=1 Tax=Neobacillus pocheonensis TaxID=363869 RepID=UPI003D2BFC8F
MKKKKLLKRLRLSRSKVVVLILIFLFDVIVLPLLLLFPDFFKEYGPGAASMYVEQVKPWTGFLKLFTDSKFRNFWMFLQPVILIVVALMFWKENPTRKNRITDGVGGPEAKGQGQFGTSRWQSDDEIESSTTVWHFDEPIKRGGIVLGMDPEEQKAYLDSDDTNVLLIGASRSGKSRFVIKPTIWELAEAGESMIITDPKGELYESTAPYLRSKGYNVKFLDFNQPGRGNRWNPMNLVKKGIQNKNVSQATKAAWNAAHMFANQKKSTGESIWTDGAESVIASLMLIIANEAPDESQKHMTSVYHTLSELGETIKTAVGEYVPLTEYIKSLDKKHPARLAYTTAKLSPERMRGSFFANVAALLRLFADPEISYLTADQDHDLAEVGRTKSAVFLIIPDEDTTRHPIAALYIDQVYQELVAESRKYGGRLPVRVNMLFDEWGNMPPIKDFTTKQTVSLGRGIRWILIVQDFGQIKDAYPNVSLSTITGNCQTWLYLITADPDTAKFISRKTGQYTVESDSVSTSVRANDNSAGYSTNLTGRALLDEGEIMRWPWYQSLVLRIRHFPARLPLPDLKEWPADKLFISGGGDPYAESFVIEDVPIFVPDFLAAEAKPGDDEVAAGNENSSFMNDVD